MSAVIVFEELRLPLELYGACLVFLLPFAGRRNCLPLRAATGVLGGCALALLYFVIFVDKLNPHFPTLQGIWYPLIGLTGVLFSRLCFVLSWSDALYINVAAYASQHLVYALLHEYLARILLPGLLQSLPLYVLLSVLFCAAFYSLIYLLFARQLKKCGGQLVPDTPRTVVFYVALYLVMIVAMSFFQSFFVASDFAGHSIFWLGGVFTALFTLMMEYSLFLSSSALRENLLLQQELESRAKYYEMSKEQIEIINRKCHDLKHTLQALKRSGDDDRERYIEDAERSVIFYKRLTPSDSSVLNTILAEKGLVCEEEHIDLQCAIDHVDLSFVRVPDLYAILGNALDNALEYVRTLDDPEQRLISLRIQKRMSFVSIQVANPYLGPALREGQLPKTSKDNSRHEHGYGLRSIRALSEQYGGGMEVSTEGGIFTVQVLIPIPEGKSREGGRE